MSMSEFPSSSALSQCALMLNDSDSDTLVRTTSETDSESSEGEFAVMPIMRPRQHVLDDMPEDVKHYWLYKYVLNWHTSSPMDIAKMLHRMATISKTHQLEVNYVVQNDYEISLAYTAHAMRVHAEMAIALPPKKKIRARRHLENTGQLVNEYKINVYNFGEKVKEFTQIYSTVSINLSSDERKEFNQPEWLRAAAQELLSPTSKVKRITFDFSIRREPLDPRNGRYTIFNKNFRDEYHDVPTTDEEGVGSAMKVLASVARKIKQSNMGERPVIKLIIKNNLTALREIDVLPSTLPIELLDASGVRAGGRRVDQSSAGSNFFLLINRVDIRSLSIYLAKNPCGLKTLILHDCNLDSSALEELSAGLAKNTSLKTLDLSKNFIRRPGVHGLNTFAGLQTFAQMLATSTTLHHVNLVNCRLRDLGADLLHQSLKANGYLQTLNLSSNVIPANHPIWGDTRVIGNAVKQVD
jgi:hypothetical protein